MTPCQFWWLDTSESRRIHAVGLRNVTRRVDKVLIFPLTTSSQRDEAIIFSRIEHMGNLLTPIVKNGQCSCVQCSFQFKS